MDCSVIIPSYNPGHFIFDLLSDINPGLYSGSHSDKDSLRDQLTDVIVIDDQSTDDSFDLLMKLRDEYHALSLLKMREKAGEAYLPRVVGAESTRSSWITTIDADDRVGEDYVLKMMSRRQDTDADIVFPVMRCFINDTAESELYAPVPDFDISKVYRGKDLIRETLGTWRISGNGGLYRREFYLEHARKFCHHQGFIYNDEIFIRHLLWDADRVAFAKVPYFYRINPESVTQKPGIRKFDLLEKNMLLRDFVMDNFGNQSVEWERISVQSFHQLIEQMRLYNILQTETSFAPEILESLKKEHECIDFSYLKGKVSGKLLNLLRFPTDKALMFLKIYDYFRHIKSAVSSKQ